MKTRVPNTLALSLLATWLLQVPLHAADAGGRLIDFSFDQVDLQTVVKIVSQHSDKRFIIDEGVEGKVTIITPRIRAKQIYPLFLSILESIGCTVIATTEPDVYRVSRLPERGLPDTPLIVPGEEIPEGGLITKIIRMHHVHATDLAKALQTRLGAKQKGRLVAVDATDHLIITDTAAAVRTLERIIREIDQPGLSRVTEVVHLEHADAVDMARELMEAIRGGADDTTPLGRAEQLRRRLDRSSNRQVATAKRDAVVVATPHSNSLLLVGTGAQVEELKMIIGQLDVDSPSGLNAIFLKYIDAEETAKVLSEVLSDSGANQQGNGGGKKISIRASAMTASLVVDARPRDYEMILKLIERLDQPPQRVHVTVVIAEVSLSDELNLGFTVAGINAPQTVGDSVLQGSLQLTDGTESLLSRVQSGIFPQGITIGVAHGVRLDGAGNLVVGIPVAVNIDALQRNAQVNIQASTSLEAENHREATASIVENIPLLTSTLVGTGNSREVIQNIERLDVGIKLRMTPHIIPGGEVQLELHPSIEAIVDPGPPNSQFAPTIARRDVSTTITVGDGKTAVISGLIREDITKVERRIPFLGSIPLLGRFFRSTRDLKQKTNLMILVTPTIIKDDEIASRIERVLREKSGLKTSDVSANMENGDGER